MAARRLHEQPLTTSRRGFFWVGGRRVTNDAGTFLAGAMYVEWEAPAQPEASCPVVLVHGGGGQGTDWLGCPDGRPGWATLLVQAGFTVYVVDRPGHGRSPLDPDLLGPLAPALSYEAARRMFTGGEQWPQDDRGASLDQFLAGQGPRRADLAAAHALEQACGVALLERIGPAVVFSHSAGGPLGWLIADARPDLVRALLAIEPLGPPFAPGTSGAPGLAWGLAAAPLSYEPAPTDPAELMSAGGPPRRLVSLAQVPIAVVSGDRSPFAAAAAEIHEFLLRSGCRAQLLALAEHGVRGNGHAMMLERNHRQVLGVILDWLAPILAGPK
ncbi:MAG: alpha/beta fold hydrolase [Solirubrobacteraceae bacterium]